MAIKYKFARVADNINGEEASVTGIGEGRKATVRPILLSDKTVDRDGLVEHIVARHPRSRTEGYMAIDMLVEAVTELLQEGNIVHIKGFGQFSVTAEFQKDTLGKMDGTSRANSLKVKNIVFKADKALKDEVGKAGFEKFNPYKHSPRKYK